VLPKNYRLRRSSDFSRAYHKGHSISDRLLVLCYIPNSLGRSRFGISVSKRIGRAVVRNRVKRRISEAIRLQLDLIAPGWDIIFIARQGTRDADYWQIESSIAGLLSRAGLYVSTKE